MFDNKLMSGKKGLVMGVANDRSISWAIAKKAYEYGAELAFTYQGDALGKRVIPLGESVGSNIILPCEVSEASSIKNVFEKINSEWGKLDFVIHGIAFSDKEELKGQYIDTTRSNFTNTMEISVYSFTEVSKFAVPLMNEGGSLLTLTYYGSERVMPHYNVMGVAKAALEASVRYLAVDLGSKNIRVNSLSAGPMKTLAASGIGDFRYILKWNELNSPLKRNVTLEDIGNAALYFLSELGSAVTGEIQHVDCGYHTVGMLAVDEAKSISDLLNDFDSNK